MMKRLTCLLALAAAAPAFAGNLIISGVAPDAPVASSSAPVYAAPPAGVSQGNAQQIQPGFQPGVSRSAVYEVLSSDRTIREVLQRWSRSSGWRHDAVHWALQRDYPVQGTANKDIFGPDYKTAVRTLLASTESTDLPAQPCFYTNYVVRVVAHAEVCDRSALSSQ